MVSAADVRRADVVIAGEQIAAVGTGVGTPDDEVLDATGCLVIPGAVDVHTHMDMEVGVTRSADDFLSGTVAAACGGTTTVIDFATAYRGESAAHGLAIWHAKARGRAVVDYGFHMTVTELTGDADDLVAEMAEAGVTSFKLYMTYPDRLMVPDEVILELMRAAGEHGAMVSLHCEDDATVASLRSEALSAGRTEPRWHAWSRPPSAETEAVKRAVRMAEETGAPLYIVHLSSAGALEQVRLARERGVGVFAETCPQYLYLSAERYEDISERAARFVCAPPLRDPWHQEELWEGLRSGALQVVATDHCPFTAADKKSGLTGGGWGDFTQIPGGLPGIETRLALVYQKVAEGVLSAPQWVDRCCTTPAKLFGLHPRKGTLEPGSDADVVVFDPGARRPLIPERLHMKIGYSPYEDVVVEGWPAHVFSRGRLVARAGEAVDAPGWGTWLRRGPSGSMADP
ncbi:MAG: dihydropyrimidinase [Actinobacteria bacterium]|nr:dihydropyrimidinase [Actinomycetota bacterium]